jgi:hypothetical protein
VEHSGPEKEQEALGIALAVIIEHPVGTVEDGGGPGWQAGREQCLGYQSVEKGGVAPQGVDSPASASMRSNSL